MPSYTWQVPNLHGIGPVVEVRIAVNSELEQLLRNAGQQLPVPVTAAALIDTGATGTVIREDIPHQLGLHPVGVATISTPSSAGVTCPEYLIRIHISPQVTVETKAVAVPLSGQPIQCLIGRDSLRHGVFIYIGYANLFSLSF